MASSKLMASSTSRNSDLKRKLSLPCGSADFLRINTGAGGRDGLEAEPMKEDRLGRRNFIELNSVPDEDEDQDQDQDQDHPLAGGAEQSSSAQLKAEIALLDEAGAVTPIGDGGFEPPRVVRKTVDDVWREIVAGKKNEKQPKEEMMTLEDFLAKTGAEEEEKVAGAAPETSGVLGVKEEQLSRGVYAYETKSCVAGVDMGMGLGVEVGSLGRGKGKRSMSLLEPLDKAAQQRQRRMIKNRESAARSRERKQAYQVELESMVARLEEERERYLREKAEQTKKRLKQIMENVIPVVEKRKPPRLRRNRSMQW
ncbi:Basic-leucine zipper (bZIP) transcription factor family protein [Striga hermonthica]|uniref:Basic-leucine zipper (BZIP) transcription factor family protein n=1 Tax=Striga hermonthica TaxID=68872 RepID=A0A9N7NM68_STRHE|nr:Basic-leucine zipper (bZIP) transcription factor family protein [Striga hermonthica]